MPEFENTEPRNDQSHNYTPSKDAKPRTRRRSGGFKKEASATPTGKMGEVDPATALREEKLSGASKKEAPKRERSENRELKPVTLKEEKAPVAKEARAEKPTVVTESRGPRQAPSPDTLAAIQKVEARIQTRRAERDAKRKESGDKPRAPSNRNAKGQDYKKETNDTGVIAAISGFFKKLFGSEPEQPKRKDPSRHSRPGSNARSGGKGSHNADSRGNGQNRQGGQGNRSGGQGRRRSGGKGRRKPQSSKSES